MAPESVIECSIDLWQLRSQRATWLRVTLAITTTRFEVEVPLVTV